MAALGVLLEVMIWFLPWSGIATAVALRFNDPRARLGGMPGRVWCALALTWCWPLLMQLWAWSNFAGLLGAVAFLTPPACTLVIAFFLFIEHRRPRRVIRS